MSRPSRKPSNRLPPERRINDIMRAAGQVFAEKGYEAALISEIAERADIVEASIYRFFANKRALLTAVVEEWYRQMLANIEEQLEGITGTRNRLRFLIWRHLKNIEDDPALARLVLSSFRSEPDYRNSPIYRENRQYTQHLIDVLQTGMEAGEIRRDLPPPLLRDMIYGGIEHHVWRYLRGYGALSPGQTAEQIVALMEGGIYREAESGAAGDRLESIADRFEQLVDRMQQGGVKDGV